MSLTILPVPKPRTAHQPYAALAALQVADVVTTGYILHHFTVAAEANPLVAAILTTTTLSVGLTVLLVFKLAVVGLLWYCQSAPKIALAVYMAVIVNNILALALYLSG